MTGLNELMIMLESGGAFILNFNISNGLIGSKFVIDDLPKIECGSGGGIRENGVILQQPVPRRGMAPERSSLTNFIK